MHGNYRIKICTGNALNFPFLPAGIDIIDNNVRSPISVMILHRKFFAGSALRLNRINSVLRVSNTVRKSRCRNKCRRQHECQHEKIFSHNRNLHKELIKIRLEFYPNTSIGNTSLKITNLITTKSP